MTGPVATQWSSVVPLIEGALPGWVPPEDQERIAAYGKYEEIYWSSEEGFAAVMRGDNENEVQMPTGRTIINTVNRYTAPDFGYVITPGPTNDTAAVEIATVAFDMLFTRENFFAKFNGGKRKCLTQGDWVWHVLADPTKPLNRRLSVVTVEPSSYFPVYEVDVVENGDPDKIVAVHLAELLVTPRETVVSRLTYRRVENEGVPPTVVRSHGIFDVQEWWLSSKPKRVVLEEEALPPEITSIPVYHVRNVDATQPFGSSDLRGLESVLVAINQTVSDEDLTLSMEGLGVYATDAGAPVDEQGRATDWVMGPGRVLTRAGNLKRINGVNSVGPYGEHYQRMVDAVRMAVGAADVAVGKVDAATAESGIALMIQLGPILAYTGEKDQTIVGVHAQMFHDLCAWFAAYEELPMLLTNDTAGNTVPSVVITPTIGAKIPPNIKEIIDRIMTLRGADPPLLSIQTAHEWLRAAGLPVPDDEMERILAEQEKGFGSLAALTRAQERDEDTRRANEENDADEDEDEEVPA